MTTPASGLETIFLSKNPDEICNRKRLTIQKTVSEFDTNSFDGEIVAIFDKLLEKKCNTPTQHKKNLKNSKLF